MPLNAVSSPSQRLLMANINYVSGCDLKWNVDQTEKNKGVARIGSSNDLKRIRMASNYQKMLEKSLSVCIKANAYLRYITVPAELCHTQAIVYIPPVLRNMGAPLCS